MTDPIDYKARIKAKGTDGTGITREHAKRMANTQGQHTMLIVDVEHSRLIIEEDGSQQIMLAITSAEPVPVEQEETVRRFQRALYLTRPDVAGQAVLQGTADGETPADAAAALDAAIVTDAAGEVSGVWDGNPDAPLTEAQAVVDADDAQSVLAGKGSALSAVPDPEENTAEVCAFPDCKLDDEHDGPHKDGAGHLLGTDVEE